MDVVDPLEKGRLARRRRRRKEEAPVSSESEDN